ncbi:MAG: hypothetical protein AB7S48_08035 [Bacteroidales bacterium]
MPSDISGKWTFNEEFECGTDKGFAVLIQKGTQISGYLEYEESIEDEQPFMVKQEVVGTFKRKKLKLEGKKATAPNGDELAGYNLDILEGTYTHEGKIVGHSFDCEDICGVFVMSR